MSLFAKTTVSQIDIDHAREVLERANFKLGKARSRAIMSSAQASADAQDLQACVDAAGKAENEFAELAERFVTPAPAEASVVISGQGISERIDTTTGQGALATVFITHDDIGALGEVLAAKDLPQGA